MATLRITTGPAQGQSIECNREVVVGREGSDFVVDDEEISRRNTAIRPGGRGLEIEDLGSMNGTFVDGERITGVATVTTDAKLRLGKTEFSLELTQADLPVVDPQRTIVRDRPVVDISDATVVRDRPLAVPEATVVREQPIFTVPEPTVVRDVIPPGHVPAADAPAPGPAPPASAPPGSAVQSPSSRPGQRPTILRVLIPLIVIAIIAGIVVLIVVLVS